MDYLFFPVDISLHTLTARNLAYEEGHIKGSLFPYISVSYVIQEEYHCPFCGKRVTNFHCNCESFKVMFAKLQEDYRDQKHESSICCDIPSDFTYACRQPIASIKTKKLEPLRIEMESLDNLFSAKRIFDPLTKCDYLIVNAKYSPTEKEITFYCKNLTTKEVFQCKLENIQYYAQKVYLNISEDIKDVSNVHHATETNKVSHDIAEFDNWESFCQKIRENLRLL